eukprot:scaffold482_cov247-Pinguiococcus_pyrenoidosus.AAC.17
MRVTAFAFAAFVATARAELIRFFGEDINPAGLGNANAVTPLTEAPNSDAARDDFFEYLVDPVGATQDLDGLTAVSFPFPSGTPPPITLTYPDGDGGFFNATIRGAFILDEVRNGQYPISERNYLRAPNNTWTITFDCDIVGFGFYGVDIGDVDGQLNVTLEFSMADGDGMLTLQAEHTQDASGNVLYFGFLNEDNKIREITIKNVEDEDDELGLATNDLLLAFVISFCRLRVRQLHGSEAGQRRAVRHRNHEQRGHRLLLRRAFLHPLRRLRLCGPAGWRDGVLPGLHPGELDALRLRDGLWLRPRPGGGSLRTVVLRRRCRRMYGLRAARLQDTKSHEERRDRRGRPLERDRTALGSAYRHFGERQRLSGGSRALDFPMTVMSMISSVGVGLDERVG